MSDAQQLQLALSQVPPRSAQVLLARCAPGATHTSFAAHYGVKEEPAEALLYRAALEFEAALAGAAPPRPATWAKEQPGARALRQALEAAGPGAADPAGAPSPGLALAAPLLDLRSHHAAVVEALDRAETLAAASPAFRRGVWLRRLAIAAIVALSAWFYWREHQTGLTPRFEPRPAQQR